MSQDGVIGRLWIKSAEHLFLRELDNGFELPPKEARGILESAKTIFNLEGPTWSSKFLPGKVKEEVQLKPTNAAFILFV